MSTSEHATPTLSPLPILKVEDDLSKLSRPYDVQSFAKNENKSVVAMMLLSHLTPINIFSHSEEKSAEMEKRKF